MLGAAALAAEAPLTVEAPAESPADSFPLLLPGRTTLVTEQTGLTRLTSHPAGAAPVFTPAKGAEMLKEQVTAFLALPENSGPSARIARLEIAWQEKNQPTHFVRTLSADMASTVTRFRRGTVTIHRTILASRKHGSVFIHLQADQPGALTFDVTLSAPAGALTRIEDRRQLVWEHGDSSARLWVFPLESDVEPKSGGLHVPGEGEALLVFFSRGPGQPDKPDLPARLAEIHDPGQPHPDPGKIWRGLLADEARATPEP